MTAKEERRNVEMDERMEFLYLVRDSLCRMGGETMGFGWY